MRFEDDSPINTLIKTVPHLAFEVNGLEKELRAHGFNVITEPNHPDDGITVAMIEHNGAPVELIEFRKLSPEKPEQKNTTRMWLISGLLFGLFMFIAMEILYPTIAGHEITQKALLIGNPLWILCGLAWGYTMKILTNKREGKKK
jgi:hypothetical protein